LTTHIEANKKTTVSRWWSRWTSRRSQRKFKISSFLKITVTAIISFKLYETHGEMFVLLYRTILGVL